MEADSEVTSRLDKIIRLLTLIATQNLSQKDKIVILSRAGFGPKDIADLIDTTPNTVSVTLTSLRKRTRQKGG